MKIIAVILIFSVLIMFMMLPIAMFGGIAQDASDQAIEQYDQLDGSNDFTPGQNSGASILNKLIDASDGSGKTR